MSQFKYGKAPEVIGKFPITCDQMMIYLYLPVVIGMKQAVPKRLEQFLPLLETASFRAGSELGLSRVQDLNVYITVKSHWVNEANPGNRPGLHVDGYGSNGDLNFIWSDTNPTEFAVQDFHDIPDDDFESMAEMERQLDPSKIVTYPNNTLLMLDESVVHRVGPAKEGMRTFVKISFSEHKYNLKGNSINYDLDYDWEYHDRGDVRNVDNKDYVK